MTRFLLALMGAILLCSAGHAQTGDAVRTGHAESKLIAETDAAVPGTTLWIALAQTLDEGWHVYWKNPGDSGLPLVLEWVLPSGFTAGPIGYPLPHRLPLGPLTNFGHEGEPTFLVPIDVPEGAQPGTVVQFDVFAEWLICLDVCIPESAQLSLRLPVAASAEGVPGQAQRIRAARSALPRDVGLGARFADDGDSIVLAVEGAPAGEAYFYPNEQGLTEPSPPQPALREVEGETLYLRLTPGLGYHAASPDVLPGVLVVSAAGQEVGVELTPRRDLDLQVPGTLAPVGEAALTPSHALAPDRGSRAGGSLGAVLLLALLGGFVLNAMPCVFPIVFLKAAGIAQLAGSKGAAVRRDALAYTAGVLTTFAIMAGLLLALRGAGAQLGWGFQLQSPVAVGLFAVLIFLIGLNLMGVFEAGTSLQRIGSGLKPSKGIAGSFLTGILAVLVAAPCIGPFLGLPIGYAVTASPVAALIVFLTLGLGLALPYLLLAAMPGLATTLPRPGAWMVRTRQLFSFAMFATAVWLIWVATLQAGASAVLALGAAFVFASLAGWLFGWSQDRPRALTLRMLAAASLIIALVPVANLRTLAVAVAPVETVKADEQVVREIYNEDRLARLQAEGTPVFVDFTAAWCITCQYNKRVVLDTPQVQALFARTGTVFMVADLTNPDPVITAAIERQGRSGVPLYLFYRGPGAPQVLPQILTRPTMREVLEP